MKTLSLPTMGGGLLEVHGPWPARRLVIFLCRDAWSRDAAIVPRIIHTFESAGLTIAEYFPEATLTSISLRRPWHGRAPRALVALHKVLQLSLRFREWHFFSRRWRERSRFDGLRDAIRHLGPGVEISLLGRSSGARLATHVADGSCVHCVVSLGYPFRPPGQPDEPARYAHLATLRTPHLIVQGRDDPYGGSNIAHDYPLSASTRIEFIDCGHDLVLPEDTFSATFATIRGFIASPHPVDRAA